MLHHELHIGGFKQCWEYAKVFIFAPVLEDIVGAMPASSRDLPINSDGNRSLSLRKLVI